MKDNTTSMKTLTFLDLQTESFEEDIELQLLLNNVPFQCHYNHDNKQDKKCEIVFLCH